MKNYLLLISCSQRKVLTPEPLPALERYDGPTYRSLRKAKREGCLPESLTILIISAKYGLFLTTTHIPNYDLKMTSVRAEAIRAQVQSELQKYLKFHETFRGTMDEVFIHLGKTYMQTLEGFDWGPIPTLEATGGIGTKTSQMKAWLTRIAEGGHTHDIV